MRVNVIFCNFQLFDDIDNDNLFFVFIESITCIMNTSLWKKNSNLKMHSFALFNKYFKCKGIKI